MTTPIGPDGITELGEEGHVRKGIKPSIAVLLRAFEDRTHVDGTPLMGPNLLSVSTGDRTFYGYAELADGKVVKLKRPVDAL